MRARPPKVPVDDYDGHQDRHGVHDEGEQQILGDQRQYERRRWQNLRYEQQEHNQWQQNADAECDLLAGLGWQVENEHAKERNQHGREDQVDGVEESLPADDDVEGDVGLRRRSLVHIEVGGHLDDVPRARLPVIR